MMTVEEAQEHILRTIIVPTSEELVDLSQSYGRVLARPIIASHPIPPFNNSSMDGYAVHAEETTGARRDRPVKLHVVGTVQAGHPFNGKVPPGSAVKIMTGAPLPEDVDAVVQVEWTKTSPPHDVLIQRSVVKGQNLRYAGEDMALNSQVLAPGMVVTPPLVGIIASIGHDRVTVYRKPKVAILATGDELVEPGIPLPAGAIHNSNSYALEAAIIQAGGEPVRLPIARDHQADIRHRLQEGMARADLVLSSGGVSVGDFDLVKPLVEELGQLDFWRVNIKPGKPLAFGRIGQTPFLGLPGNPVSSLVTFELFVRPVIRRLSGHREVFRRTLKLPLYDDFAEVTDRRHYVRSRLIVESHQLWVSPYRNTGSAVQSSWVAVEGLMVVPENTGPYAKGQEMDVVWLHDEGE